MNMWDQECDIDGCTERATISDRDGGLCSRHSHERDAKRRAEERRATKKAGGPWKQTCPRRYEMFQQGGAEEQDTWDIREQMHKGLRSRHCSYCGSLHPDEFMKLVKEGWVVGPTDKSYKAYLGSPPTEERLAKLQEEYGDDDSEFAQGMLKYPSGGQETKFYFQHLSEDQKKEFIRLYNDKTMKMGYPGHFYSLPFFVTRSSATD